MIMNIKVRFYNFLDIKLNQKKVHEKSLLKYKSINFFFEF